MQESHIAINEASLVDSSLHSPAVLELTQLKMSRALIEYAVDSIIETVDYAMGRPSSSRGRSAAARRHPRHPEFLNFVNNVLYKAEVKVPVLLVALVYVDRARPHLQIALEQWACERVFMGALILANKYCNDSTLKNVHWALCTGVFGKRDIGRIEREFLDVLDYELSISESDILSHHTPILAALPHRHHARQHISDVPQTVKFTRTTTTTTTTATEEERSSWSSDSDDSESDDDMPMPATPHHHASLPVPAVSIVTSKSSSLSSSSLPQEPKVVVVSSHSHSHTHTHSHRLTSALSLLKSFPLPHFHHSSSSESESSISVGSGGVRSSASSLVESGVGSQISVAA
ncbi:hypothetical protein BDY19DRAFT_895332 [Irpex rosettiformis]|uniref:Uncharacterized protein n=1 Tax=Irpex rosettiformis TaxID=378272 RepID=A0ACB8TWR1_9APHY|nr:hypothetical protein BDY19DRAFT_895332 [Irpex rosettiformis]